MKRGEKPEGYRQMRPKTFPASNYSANSQQMLQEIRNSLRNLPKPSDPPKMDASGAGKGHPEDPRQQWRCSNPKNPHHKALQEIRKSLMPFANEPNTSGSELNKHLSLEAPSAGFEEPGNSRSLGVSLDYMGKVTYQDSMREQMAVNNPNATGMKAPGSHMQQSVLRRPSWKGSKESLAPRHGPMMVDGMMYRSDSPGPPPAFPQGHPANNQRGNPPPNRGAMPGTTSWDNNPSTKRYSGNMDYLVPRISPVPQGAWSDGYPAAAPQNQRGMSPVSVGHQPIIMQSSGGSKFNFPSSWSQNGSPQPDYMAGSSRQPPPPYPVNQSSRHSPTDQQLQTGGPSSSPSYVNGGNIPQSMLVPNRNSHNLDLCNLGPPQSWSQPPLVSNQPQSSSGDLSPSWQHNKPVHSNSFNNHQLNGRAPHASGSQPSATTVTAITQAPILQPVKSIRVHKPELHTAVAPTHPPWLQQAPPPSAPAPAYPEPPAPVSQIPAVAEVPSYQGPPPPYPKHLLQQAAAPFPPAYDPGVNKLSSGRDDPAEEEGGGGGGGGGGGDGSRDKAAENPKGSTPTEKEKKQITTSPVPVRRNKKDEERRGESGRVALYSPQAFKFFMEQHVENILKNHQMRIRRRKQLESEMQRPI